MPYFGIRYTERAQLKIYNRIVASCFSLSEAERAVLLFILQRTVGWQNAWEAISLKEFQGGVFRRRAGKKGVIIRGTGLPQDQLIRAIENLHEIGAVEAREMGTATVYRIEEDWCHPDLHWLSMWELREDEYDYPRDADECDEPSLAE